MCRQKQFDTDLKAFQQIKYVVHLKNVDGENADGTQSMFILTILEKIKKNETTVFLGSVTIFEKKKKIVKKQELN